MRKKTTTKKSPQGVALLLVMTVIVVVLSTVTIGVTLLLNNLDESKSRQDTEQALASAYAGIEKVKGYYKNNPSFFSGCAVNDCVDFSNTSSCVACSNARAMFTDGSRRYRVAITSLNTTDGVGLLSTGYRGLYNRTVRDAVKFTIFLCGDPVKGIIEDRDGYQYPTVQVDDQCWMAASLLTKTKRDATCINGGGTPPCPDASSADDNQGRACYDNDEFNCTDQNRGALYTWEAAMDGDNDENAQGLCPDGWHLPSDKRWLILETYFTTSGDCSETRSSALGNEYECDNAGETLAVGGSSGFEAVFSGYREDGTTFSQYSREGKFWTSTGNKPTIFRSIQSGVTTFGRDELGKNEKSFSIRCQQD